MVPDFEEPAKLIADLVIALIFIIIIILAAGKVYDIYQSISATPEERRLELDKDLCYKECHVMYLKKLEEIDER